MLTTEQQEVLKLVQADHNLVVCGQAGTGKTYLIQELYKQLKRDKSVKIVCTTGIACTAFPVSMGAQTLHSWTGILDGRYSLSELEDMVASDQFDGIRRDIQQCDLLIIDEVSMLSARIFEQVETVCRIARANNCYFGNMQLVAVGDFFQLPPVANERYGDQGEPCFHHEIWEEVFPTKLCCTL